LDERLRLELGEQQFSGHYDATHTGTTLTKNSSLNLSSYNTATSPLVNLSWNQWVVQGSGSTSQTQTPAMDDTTDTTGTWISTGANRLVRLMTVIPPRTLRRPRQRWICVFGYSPSFSVPAGSTITDVTVNYTAKVGIITYVGAGTTATASNGNVTPTLPAGWQANDIFICVVSSHDNQTATMPSGWTAWESGTNQRQHFEV